MRNIANSREFERIKSMWKNHSMNLEAVLVLGGHRLELCETQHRREPLAGVTHSAVLRPKE